MGKGYEYIFRDLLGLASCDGGYVRVCFAGCNIDLWNLWWKGIGKVVACLAFEHTVRYTLLISCNSDRYGSQGLCCCV